MRVANAETTIQRYVAQYDMARFLNKYLLECLHLFHFPVYSNIYTEQDEQHFLYFLVEGQVQCNHYHPNGKLAVFALVKPFAAIGDVEILNEEKVRSNVIAMQDTVMLGIPSSIIHHYGADDPRFLHFLIEQLRQKMFNQKFLQMNQLLSVSARLALYILSQPTNPDGAIILPEKESLASLLGTTTRHLNRVLRELVESGSISAGYPLVRILDKSALEAFTI